MTYARKDHELRKKLTEIKYICDDPSSKRRITTVVEENEVLKSQIDEMEQELSVLKKEVTYAKSNPTYMYEDDDEFPINNMHFHDDSGIDKQSLTVKRRKKGSKKSQMSDNKSAISDLNQAFIDKSRLDTSNMMVDDNSLLGGALQQLNKSNMSTNECSRCKKLMFENQKQAKIISELQKNSKEKQNLFDSFGIIKNGNDNYEEQFDIHKDSVLSGNHVREPKTIELKDEIAFLDKSIGSHVNKTISYIRHPRFDEDIESPIRCEEVFGSPSQI